MSGCEEPPARAVSMKFQATNTADHILIVEGETDLPGGSPLKAELRNREDQVLSRDSAVVRKGKFYFDFDLTTLSGLSLYQVRVKFDPQDAPLGVRRTTGLWGQALEGKGVRDKVDGRNGRYFEQRIDVLLTNDATGQDWEGRDFGAMDVSERSRITGILEKQVEEKPGLRSAKFALARAYIASDGRELAAGSRSHVLLQDVIKIKDDDAIGRQVQQILQNIDLKEATVEAAKVEREKLTSGAKYLNERSITPGQSIGAFNLGMSYRILQHRLKFDSPPIFSEAQEFVVAKPKEPTGVELTFRSTDRRLQSVRTTSEAFRLPEGFGVGSMLHEIQQAYGTVAVPTPTFRQVRVQADGRVVYKGTIRTSGLEFEIRRVVDPVFPLPVDLVDAIVVFEEKL